MKKTTPIFKCVCTVILELFTLFTVVLLLVRREYSRLPMALLTLLLAALPALAEKCLRCRFCLPLYLFSLVYAVGPMLGQCWKFYYIIPGWDKLLHISGGVLFALIGFYLFSRLTPETRSPLATVIFALCFSMAVSMLWEFVEFGADRFLGMDMQNDTVVTALHSYLLGAEPGVTGSIESICSVTVNGIPLPVGGYLDIGLTDTILDMLLETLGALLACCLLWLDRGRHRLLYPSENTYNPAQHP